MSVAPICVTVPPTFYNIADTLNPGTLLKVSLRLAVIILFNNSPLSVVVPIVCNVVCVPSVVVTSCSLTIGDVAPIALDPSHKYL